MITINISRDIQTNIYDKINRNGNTPIYLISRNMSTRNITDLCNIKITSTRYSNIEVTVNITSTLKRAFVDQYQDCMKESY